MSNSAEYNAVRSKRIKLQEGIAKNSKCILPLAERLNDDRLLPGPTLMAIQDEQSSFNNATKIVGSVLQHIEHDPSAFYKFVTHLKEVGLDLLADLLLAGDIPVSRTSDASEEERLKLAKKVLKENQVQLKDVIVAGGLVDIVHACEAKGLIAEEKKRQLVDLTRGRSEDERAFELLDTIRRSLLVYTSSNVMDKFLCIISNNGGDAGSRISRQMASEYGFPLTKFYGQNLTDYRQVKAQASAVKTSFSEVTNYEKPHCDEVEDVDYHQDGTEETEEQQEENKRLKDEKPLLTEIEKKIPLRKIQRDQPLLYEKVRTFCDEVQFILHTVNLNEVKAVLSLLDAPDLDQDDGKKLEKPIDLDRPNSIVLGMFGGHRCAMIQTEMGDDCRDEVERALAKFKNAEAILAIGVAYAQPSKDIKFGDVLVSKRIIGVGNIRENEDGTMIPKDDSTLHCPLSRELKEVFTRDPEFSKTFNVAIYKQEKRPSKVHCGTIVSDRVLLDNKGKRDDILKRIPGAIGGEMEGHVLLDIRRKYSRSKPPRIIDVIIIKGAADYADGAKTKEWQPVAAMAAARYVQDKLEVLSASTSGSPYHQTTEDKPSGASSSDRRSRSGHRSGRKSRYRSRSPLNTQKSKKKSDSTEVRDRKRPAHPPERDNKRKKKESRPCTSDRLKKDIKKSHP